MFNLVYFRVPKLLRLSENPPKCKWMDHIRIIPNMNISDQVPYPFYYYDCDFSTSLIYTIGMNFDNMRNPTCLSLLTTVDMIFLRGRRKGSGWLTCRTSRAIE